MLLLCLEPIYGIAGSGMHRHTSLFKDGQNAFYDPSREDGLRDTGRHFIAGILNHAKAISAITSPTVNSHKRLVPGYEAPVYIAWTYRNRQSINTYTKARRGGEGTRIELRSPDPTCNPLFRISCGSESWPWKVLKKN